MARGSWWLASILALGPACGGGTLRPGDMTAAGSGGGGGGGAGGTAEPVRCGQIATRPGIFNPCGETRSLAYSPDGRLLAASVPGPGPNVMLWRLSDGLLVHRLDGVGEATFDVSFSPDGKLLATAGGYATSGSSPGIVKLWNVADGSLLMIIPAHCGSLADAASFSHDGTMLVTAGAAGPVEVWRVSDGAPVTSIAYPTTVNSARFSPDDSQVIIGGVDGRATVWSLASGELMVTVQQTGAQADAAFSPDGSEIATTGANMTVAVWDAATGYALATLAGHRATVSHVVWVGADLIVSNDWNGTVRSWVRSSGIFQAAGARETGGQSFGLAVSPDQQMLAVGGGAEDGFWFMRLADLTP